MATVKVNEKEYRLRQGKVIKREEEFGHSYFHEKLGWLIGCTTVLSMAIPPDPSLIKWWKDNSAEESDEILNRATQGGTRVHQACESLLLGEKVKSDDLMTSKEKKSVAAFIDWFRTWNPEEAKSEQVVAYINDKTKVRFAGTLDLICKINDEWTIIDFKTGRRHELSHDLQIAAYAKAIEQSTGIRVTRKFCLYLGTMHKGKARTRNSLGMIKSGVGWNTEESKRPFEDFLKVYDYALFLAGGYPDPPVVQSYPEYFQLLEITSKQIKQDKENAYTDSSSSETVNS